MGNAPPADLLGGVLARGQGGPHARPAAAQRVFLQHTVLQAQVEAAGGGVKGHGGDGRAGGRPLLPAVQ
jgi:hypothetical protein